jgi:hypothetical protein
VASEVGTLGTPPPPPPPAPVTPYVLKPPRPKRSPRTVRSIAATFLLFGAVLVAVSMGVSWWGYSEQGKGISGTESFYPGNSYYELGTFPSGAVNSWQTYTTSGLLHVGQLYEAVLAVGILAALLGFVATVLGYLGAINSFHSRRSQTLTLLLVIVAFASTVALPITVAVGQPSAYNTDASSYLGGCGPSPNPCTGLWGSQTAAGVTQSFGADIGWYLALAAAVFFVLALVQLLGSRRAPYTREEVAAAAAQPNWSEGLPPPPPPMAPPP